MELIDYITDLLTDFDEMGFAPTTLCPDPEAYAIEWRNKITKAFNELTAENERLRGVGIPDDAVYIRLSDAKTAILKYACEQTVSKYASSEICKAVRNGAEGAMNELDYLTPVSVAPIADTVRKMQERFDNRVKDKLSYHGWYLKETIMPSIAKEMLNDES